MKRLWHAGSRGRDGSESSRGVVLMLDGVEDELNRNQGTTLFAIRQRLSGKFGDVFASIPFPIFAAIYCGLFGYQLQARVPPAVCQRSSQCPMCWQTIGMKDPTSQELLEAVERERSIRLNHAQAAAIFHHQAIGDFELQHFSTDESDAELEERIIQHLAAAARGRAHHIARRGRVRSGSQGPQYLVVSTNQNSPSVASVGENESPAVVDVDPSLSIGGESIEVTNGFPSQVIQIPLLTSRASDSTSRPSSSPRTPSPVNQDRPAPSELQSLSETLRSRWSTVSTRYKESIARNTRGWRERLFSRNSSVADIGSEIRREVNIGIATVSRMVERLDTRERRTLSPTASPGAEVDAAVEPKSEGVSGSQANSHVNTSASSTSCSATSGSH